jgi:Glu-tRNA(Gln) amidotransferase subunit E-like FAD-binding protein
MTAPEYKSESLIEFKNNMKALGLYHKEISGYNCYRIPYETLKAIADKKHWLHNLDSDIIASRRNTEDEDEELQEGVIKEDLSVKATLDEQIEHYTKLLQSLKEKKENPKLNTTNVTEKPKIGMDKYFEKPQNTTEQLKQLNDIYEKQQINKQVREENVKALTKKPTSESPKKSNVVNQNLFKKEDIKEMTEELISDFCS